MNKSSMVNLSCHPYVLRSLDYNGPNYNHVDVVDTTTFYLECRGGKVNA